MKAYWSFGLLGLVFFLVACGGGQTRPAASSSNGAGGPALANTDWKGTYASGTSSNIPATLHIYSQNGSLMGTLTYDGYEETVDIITTPRGLQIKGVSYRDLRGGRNFYLDTFSAEVSTDGRGMNATGGDTNSAVASQWLKLQKVDASAGVPAP